MFTFYPGHFNATEVTEVTEDFVDGQCTQHANIVSFLQSDRSKFPSERLKFKGKKTHLYMN